MLPPPMRSAEIVDRISRYTDRDVELWMLHFAFDVANGHALASDLADLFDTFPANGTLEQLITTLTEKHVRARTRRLTVGCGCSRIMHAETFRRYHYDGHTGAINGQELLEEMKQWPDRIDPASCKNMLRGYKPFFFVVSNDDYNTLVSNKSAMERPDVVMEGLGLANYPSRVPLVRIEFLADTINSLNPGAPTAVDAIGFTPFSPSNEPDGWGRTIHLGSFSAVGVYQDGMREALVDPVAAATCVRITPVGTTLLAHIVDHTGLIARARARFA